jgi:TonB family protein
MPDKEDHKKPEVSAELIRQYLAGELDDKAMHALEHQALDDPFLAEALEGFDQHPADQQANLEDLHARLAARVAPRQTRVRPLYYRWAAAAAILLLISSGVIWIWQQQIPKERTIVKVEEQHHDTTANLVQDTNTADRKAETFGQNESTSIADAQAKKIAEQEIKSAPATQDAVPAIAQIAKKEAKRNTSTPHPATAKIASAEAIAANNAASAAVPISAADSQLTAPEKPIMYAKPPAPLSQLTIIKGKEAADAYSKTADSINPGANVENQLQGKVAGVSISSKEQGRAKNITIRGASSIQGTTQAGILRGKVIDQKDGNSLPGVSVKVAGKPMTGAVTDSQGYFYIPVADTSKPIALEFNYIGYDKKQLKIHQGDNDLEVALAVNNKALAETVVTGYGVAGKSPASSEEAPVYRAPAPSVGWQKYLQQIKQNVVYPESAKEKKISGKVRVSFNVMRDGSLQDFEVLKSMGPEFDSAAIRAIKAGSSWIPASDQQPTRVKIKVPFAPPKAGNP